LSRRGIAYLHLSPKARERGGWPDLTFSVSGWDATLHKSQDLWIARAYAVELKSASGRLSDVQRAVLGQMQSNGWIVRVVRSFEDFRALIGGDLSAGECLLQRD